MFTSACIPFRAYVRTEAMQIVNNSGGASCKPNQTLSYRNVLKQLSSLHPVLIFTPQPQYYTSEHEHSFHESISSQQQERQQQPGPDPDGEKRRTDTDSAATPNDRLENLEQVDRLAREGDNQEGGGGEAASAGGYGATAGDAYAEGEAEAVHQWVEYGTGPYPSDDGTGWLAVSAYFAYFAYLYVSVSVFVSLSLSLVDDSLCISFSSLPPLSLTHPIMPAPSLSVSGCFLN